MTRLLFHKQNNGWNADPNAVEPKLVVMHGNLLLAFPLNPYIGPFEEGDWGHLRFGNCSRFRIDGTNDHAWFGGQCRYSRVAPEWGEFYELTGNDPTLEYVTDWIHMAGSTGERHFLFYFRDNMFECFASDWKFDDIETNALKAIA